MSKPAKAEYQEIVENDNETQRLTDSNIEQEQMDTGEQLKINIKQISEESDTSNINNTFLNLNIKKLKGLESIKCKSPTPEPAPMLTEKIIREEESLNCFLCTNLITFPNLYEFQCHLGLQHYRQQIADTYLPPRINTSPFPCTICIKESGKKVSFDYETFLIIHLATSHNCCIEFVEKNIEMLSGIANKLRNAY